MHFKEGSVLPFDGVKESLIYMFVAVVISSRGSVNYKSIMYLGLGKRYVLRSLYTMDYYMMLSILLLGVSRCFY